MDGRGFSHRPPHVSFTPPYHQPPLPQQPPPPQQPRHPPPQQPPLPHHPPLPHRPPPQQPPLPHHPQPQQPPLPPHPPPHYPSPPRPPPPHYPPAQQQFFPNFSPHNPNNLSPLINFSFPDHHNHPDFASQQQQPLRPPQQQQQPLRPPQQPEQQQVSQQRQQQQEQERSRQQQEQLLLQNQQQEQVLVQLIQQEQLRQQQQEQLLLQWIQREELQQKENHQQWQQTNEASTSNADQEQQQPNKMKAKAKASSSTFYQKQHQAKKMKAKEKEKEISYQPKKKNNVGVNVKGKMKVKNVSENVKPMRKKMRRVDALVASIRREWAAANNKYVSAIKIGKAVLRRMDVPSWESLGFEMQEVPSMLNLIMTESKIRTFIHCHVAIQRITTLFDLQVAICKDEGIQKFEELELGPLVRHPLVRHYFYINKDVKEVHEITCEHVVGHLSFYLYRKNRNHVEIQEFLKYIAKQRKLKSCDKLGVRIRSLGLYISLLHKTRGSQDLVLNKCMVSAKERFVKLKRIRPPYFLEQKELDERFNTTSQHVKSFASVDKDVFGQDVTSLSLGSDDDVKHSSDGEEKDGGSSMGNPCPSSVIYGSGGRVSNCPDPFATEKASRQDSTGEMHELSSPLNHSSEPPKKTRKAISHSHGKAVAVSPTFMPSGTKDVEEENSHSTDYFLAEDSIRMFITTWKETCRRCPAREVFERMLQYYNFSKRLQHKLRKAMSMYPLIGLLNVAVTSLKQGMWDNMFETFHSMGESTIEKAPGDELTEYASNSIDKIPGLFKGFSDQALCFNAEDILQKASQYLAASVVSSGGSSLLHRVVFFAKQLSYCEGWLAEQFGVNDFQLLGHGNFLSFLERNSCLLPQELLKYLRDVFQEQWPFEISMTQKQLIMLLSQALGNVWEDDVVTKEKVSELLRRQFPLICFKTSKNGDVEELVDFVRHHRINITSSSVIFSATLLGTSTDASGFNGCDLSELMADIDQISSGLGPVTSRDAINVLLSAPFLTDLSSWSHWDPLYAPSLGPLVEWLLSEVNVKGLLCLLTRDGKIIRIDHSSSADLFLKALIQESPFQAAVQLVSLFSVSGGKRHVPLSLLKCQSRQGFEVVMANALQSTDSSDGPKSNKMFRELDSAGGDSSINPSKNLCALNKDVACVSRIVIDCLAFMPSEFRCFAADVLLSGLQSLVKDIASAVLLQSQGAKERLMLHEVGFSLGIVEWINDHHSLCPITDKNCLASAGAPPSMCVGLDLKVSKDVQCSNGTDVTSTLGGLEVDDSENVVSRQIAVQEFNVEEAAAVIESIRREEFGLDSNMSDIESSMLKKQHARLGRALCCLSQELYSQDSHFLLELVQNADDNVYPANVEPTLSFIIQDTRIIVLNNEKGFKENNIRALCDIGNSTKRGSSAGYIGQKGLGFKSVFRVTDAPEIHSNGFHIKFDIREGQIGYILPTNVSPCDMEMFNVFASNDDIRTGFDGWNTCIVLPFKLKLLESGTSSILSVFSDLHPSLLLFLNRLQSIELRNVLNDNDSHIVMRKEVLGDGIVKVSCGKEKMIWFLASSRLQPKINRSNVRMTEISIAFMLQETENGDYEPLLGQQPVFSFLPLRTYGLKFILQADFVLPSSREEVDGDSPWNQWLLSEFPGLVVDAEKLFCSLACFQENPAKAVSTYMSFIPLVGEVHGFFAGLPRMIISKLRQSNCLLVNGYKDRWVAPCKVLRGWNEQAQRLLPDTLLAEHLGLGLLHRDIHLSDSFSSALGIKEYHPAILVQFMTSLGLVKDGIKSMGLGWLFSYLNELDSLLHSYAPNVRNAEFEQDIIRGLTKVPFIPLSDGTYGSLDDAAIWLHTDCLSAGSGGILGYEAFPNLYGTLRIVSPALFSEASGDVTLLNNCSRMLRQIGVKQMSAHELIRIHILPNISDYRSTDIDQQLMVEYITFVMLHLQTNCIVCHDENDQIISELRTKAFLLTNHGYQRPIEVPIHFSQEFGNPVDVKKIIHSFDYNWHEVDMMYLKHPITESMACRLVKWREFFQKLGVTDFVKVVASEKSVADLCPDVPDQIINDRHLTSPESLVKDWESSELVDILSQLSKDGNQENCKYLLEVLDALWDDNFSDKVLEGCMASSSPNGLFLKSSVTRCISDFRWVVSSIDSELHYPKELFHDCDAIRSILGSHAPYAVPTIKSIKLLREIGFKTEATLDDVLAILQTWRTLKSPFSTSLLQMTKLYAFISKSMSTSGQQVREALSLGPFIFVPYAVKLHEDAVTGAFLSPGDVCWHDSTGALDHWDDGSLSVKTSSMPSINTLCSIYPSLHDFFVNECGVNETPSFHHYVQILNHLSRNTLPLVAAHAVFRILLKWSDDFHSGALSSDDLTHFKNCLTQLDFTVLPTMQDRWVSLHPNFGLICWSDDNSLKKQFKNVDNMEFLYFGELTSIEKELLRTKLSAFLQNLGIPSLSGVLSREAIYSGLADPGAVTSMVEWVLPFAQRFIYHLHPEKYAKLKLARFSALHDLRVVVVQKLFYRNVIKRCNWVSKEKFECNSLLEDNILYTTRKSDSHSLFMELSRLLFGGTLDLHLANFLHLITTMAQSGSTEKQTEFFVLKSQNMAKLPSEEPVWSLSSTFSSPEDDEVLLGNAGSRDTNEKISSKSKKRTAASICPSMDLKSAPFDSHAREKRIRTQAVTADRNGNLGTIHDLSGDIVQDKADLIRTKIDDHIVTKDAVIIEPDSTGFPLSGYQIDDACDLPELSMEALTDSTSIAAESFCPEEGKSKSSGKEQLLNDTYGYHQATQTGRQGERVAFRYFFEEADGTVVNWVNQDKETGLPYDIVLGEDENTQEFIEVKTSRYATKDWFEISTREWQFAAEKGDRFSIAHVILPGQKLAKITVYKNPAKLCQLRKLRLALMKPRETSDVFGLQVQEKIPTTLDGQKLYADQHSRHDEFEAGDRVLLRVPPTKGMMRFGRRGKSNPKYEGPYEILDRVGKVTYRLALPMDLPNVYSVFHVSQLRRYIDDPSDVLHNVEGEIDSNLINEKQPVKVMDSKIRNTRNKMVKLVKVLWTTKEATWEAEEEIREQYPHLFNQVLAIDQVKATTNTKPEVNKGASLAQRCHCCNKIGHLKRNCPKYTDDLSSWSCGKVHGG